ncbi:cysteine proteinase [Zopfia rhizophila CBS 207.26]|uniref:Cysteine proteinase n=1 Tax=Zopfia rhizophila CBS 207.26 TaxID=1314779 RepID=A0A6A6EAU4_9PEZI|nr:cysteine proteinase [Zopfia rhizophila CBS 207.26]
MPNPPTNFSALPPTTLPTIDMKDTRGKTEFPLLLSAGMYAGDIVGDGNCLFNALSDQMFGHQGEHRALRDVTIEHICANKDHYASFIAVHPGGGTRRNPKRKNVNAPYRVNNTLPSQEDIDRQFDKHVQEMRRTGTWGDNMELTAFSSEYNVYIRIWQEDLCYLVSPRPGALRTNIGDVDDTSSDGSIDTNHERPVLNIAYHNWQHYSSVRDINGPHTGLPNLKLNVLTSEERAELQGQLPATAPRLISPSKIKAVHMALPFLVANGTAKLALEETKGSIDAAVSLLIANESRVSSPARSQESSSIERDGDSEDEQLVYGPNKRRNRRLSHKRPDSKKQEDNGDVPKAYKEKRPDSRKQDYRDALNAYKEKRQQILKLRMGQKEDPLSQEAIASIELPEPSSNSEWNDQSSSQGSRSSASASPSPEIPLPPMPFRTGPSTTTPSTASDIATPSASQDTLPTASKPEEPKAVKLKLILKQPQQSNKSKLRQDGPQRTPARDNKDMKKQAQKTARKQRAIAEAKGLETNKLPVKATVKKPSPELAEPFRTFQI